MQQIEIFDDRMPGFNEIISAAKVRGSRRGSRVSSSYSTMKKFWTNRIAEELIVNRIKPVEKVFLDITWYERNKKRDPDNIAAFIKFILDGMQKAGVIKNDGWAQVVGWNNSFKVVKQRGVKIVIK